MNEKDIATPKRTKALLDQYGFKFKKSLGQNFLIDTNIIQKIISASDIDENTGVIEVGPGMGSLTEQLARVAKSSSLWNWSKINTCIEDTLNPYSNVTIVKWRYIKSQWPQKEIDQHLKDCDKIMLVANLPYYITSPILMNLLENDLPIDVVVMMQRSGRKIKC